MLDIFVPGGDDKETFGENQPTKENTQNNKNTHGKETGNKLRISYGCEATRGGYWNSLMKEDEDEGLQCQACCPATFRRHP